MASNSEQTKLETRNTRMTFVSKVKKKGPMSTLFCGLSEGSRINGLYDLANQDNRAPRQVSRFPDSVSSRVCIKWHGHGMPVDLNAWWGVQRLFLSGHIEDTISPSKAIEPSQLSPMYTSIVYEGDKMHDNWDSSGFGVSATIWKFGDTRWARYMKIQLAKDDIMTTISGTKHPVQSGPRSRTF